MTLGNWFSGFWELSRLSLQNIWHLCPTAAKKKSHFPSVIYYVNSPYRVQLRIFACDVCAPKPQCADKKKISSCDVCVPRAQHADHGYFSHQQSYFLLPATYVSQRRSVQTMDISRINRQLNLWYGYMAIRYLQLYIIHMLFYWISLSSTDSWTCGMDVWQYIIYTYPLFICYSIWILLASTDSWTCGIDKPHVVSNGLFFFFFSHKKKGPLDTTTTNMMSTFT